MIDALSVDFWEKSEEYESETVAMSHYYARIILGFEETKRTKRISKTNSSGVMGKFFTVHRTAFALSQPVHPEEGLLQDVNYKVVPHS